MHHDLCTRQGTISMIAYPRNTLRDEYVWLEEVEDDEDKNNYYNEVEETAIVILDNYFSNLITLERNLPDVRICCTIILCLWDATTEDSPKERGILSSEGSCFGNITRIMYFIDYVPRQETRTFFFLFAQLELYGKNLERSRKLSNDTVVLNEKNLQFCILRLCSRGDGNGEWNFLSFIRL